MLSRPSCKWNYQRNDIELNLYVLWENILMSFWAAYKEAKGHTHTKIRTLEIISMPS
jgi:hypothetical protein